MLLHFCLFCVVLCLRLTLVLNFFIFLRKKVRKYTQWTFKRKAWLFNNKDDIASVSPAMWAGDGFTPGPEVAEPCC